MPAQINIEQIAHELNHRARTHEVGHLQQIRKELKHLKRRPTSDLFDRRTIDQHWAYHVGGRRELQFNIGIDHIDGQAELRHGVAFSFEPSQWVPYQETLEALRPRVDLFNKYIARHAGDFCDMRMWHYGARQTHITRPHPPAPIAQHLIERGAFFFLGRKRLPEPIDCDAILDDFDRLLPLFTYIESRSH